jgi:toxin FitB
MPILRFLADTNVAAAWMAQQEPVHGWLDQRRAEVAISTITLAEIRRGIELRGDTKARRELERDYRFLLQDFSERIWLFDEAAAGEWGRLMAEAQTKHHSLTP